MDSIAMYCKIWLRLFAFCWVCAPILLAQDSPGVTAAEAERIQRAQAAEADKAGAGIALLEAIPLDKRSAAEWFSLGTFHAQRDQPEPAAAAFRASLEQFPRFRAAALNLALIRLRQGQTEAARTLLTEWLRENSGDVEVLRLLGQTLLLRGEAVSAETVYRQWLLQEAEAEEAKLGLLHAWQMQGQHGQVLALVEAWLPSSVQRAELWDTKANAELALGREDEALRTLEQARRLGLKDPLRLATLGELYLRGGMPAEAAARFREAFADGAGELSRLIHAADTLAAAGLGGDAEVLAGWARARLKQSPEAGNPPEFKMLEARLALTAGKPEAAAEHLRALLREAPLRGDALLLLAELEAATGRTEVALALLRSAARLQGVEADALIQMARLEAARGAYGLAVDLLDRALVFGDRPRLRTYQAQLRRMGE